MPYIGVCFYGFVVVAKEVIGAGAGPAGDLPFIECRQPYAGPGAIGLHIAVADAGNRVVHTVADTAAAYAIGICLLYTSPSPRD